MHPTNGAIGFSAVFYVRNRLLFLMRRKWRKMNENRSLRSLVQCPGDLSAIPLWGDRQKCLKILPELSKRPSFLLLLILTNVIPNLCAKRQQYTKCQALLCNADWRGLHAILFLTEDENAPWLMETRRPLHKQLSNYRMTVHLFLETAIETWFSFVSRRSYKSVAERLAEVAENAMLRKLRAVKSRILKSTRQKRRAKARIIASLRRTANISGMFIW